MTYEGADPSHVRIAEKSKAQIFIPVSGNTISKHGIIV
jgi:hypothetical protein